VGILAQSSKTRGRPVDGDYEPGSRGETRAMTERTQGLEMTLPAESANVALVRHAVSGVAEDGGMDEERIADLKTVVTEACMNVVVHAYPHGTGLMRIDVTPEDDSLLITVSDSGVGIRPSVDLEEEASSLRLGFSLISRLCTSFAISGGLDRGTTITMRLPMSGEDPGSPAAGEDPESLPGEVRIVASRPELLSSMLSRAISAFAARRDLSVDQISDAMLLADAISAGAPAVFEGGEPGLSLSDAERGIDLRVGPLTEAGAAKLRQGLSLPEIGGSIESIASDVRSEKLDGGEYVVYRLATQ
jgi:anti-sigma regulatory factor (Ser/Thr protein kinase)